MVAVQLDAVESGLLGPLGRVGVADDDGLDLGDGEGLELPGEAQEQRRISSSLRADGTRAS